MRGDQHPLSSLANAAALLFDALGDINWAGFYLLDRGALWLGPFQGKAACTRIDPGKGVCGAALAQNQTLLVPDVHAFPGHIACDEASRAEIVVPLRVDGRAVGVLDIDSPVQNRFSQDDRAVLERVAALIEARCDFTRCGYDLL
ncbi:hypothetical protein FACS1894196_1390 [Clostridia bacterium]|nr:hypothetical protein FACS1894196_1390 [Clostridia bacterium]